MHNTKIKPSFDTSRQVLGEVLPLDTPFTLILDPGDICNFRCSYCFRGNPSGCDCGSYNKNVLMSWNTFQRSADQLMEFQRAPKVISLSCHGEPLCNPLLPKMAAYIKNLGTPARTSIHTNASLLDERMAESLVEARLDRIVVSIQGMSAEEYRKTSGVKLDYERFFKRLRYFYEIKTNTEVCVKIVDVALQRPKEEFYEIFSQVADRVFIEKAVPIWGKEDIDCESVNKYGEKFKAILCCPLVFHTLVVTSVGNILPCSRLNPPLFLGAIFETTLANAWNSQERREFLKKMIEQGRSACEVCSGCYIAQNSVYAKEDIIDEYRDVILNKLELYETSLA